MEQSDLSGFARPSGKRIVLIHDQSMQVLMVEGRRYMQWTDEDRLTKRIAIAQLYELDMGSQEEIAAAFGISTKSVYNYVRIFATKGSAGFILRKKGPKGQWKISPEVRAKILYTFLKEGAVDYGQIKARLHGWGERVGLTSIRKVLLENGLVQEVPAFADLANPAELFHTNEDENQLVFDFPGSEAENWQRNAQQQEQPSHPPVSEQQNMDHVFSPSTAKPRRRYSAGQRMYLDQLKQGGYNSYAGGLLFTPYLSHYPLSTTVEEIIDIPTHEGYSLEELVRTLFYFDVFGFRSMEDFKRVYAEEFGLLLGRSSSPSLFTLRRFLHKIRTLGKSEELIEAFATLYLKTGLADWGVLYIDAHFLPYHGMVPITKGWHGVRQMAMKGSYHFLGVDERFHPWIFLVRSSSEDLLQKIPEMVEKAKKAARAAGVEEHRLEELILVFDREGFSGPLYGYLDGRDRDDRKKRALFVSWAKYADKWVYAIPGNNFGQTAVVSYEIRKPQRIRYFETERRMSKYGKIRAIVIERAADEKRMAIYTNGSQQQISSEKVVQLICRRWGQENLIKELLDKHFINYMPGYVRQRLEEQLLVDNPQVKQLRKQRGTLVSELHTLKVQLADKILKETKNETNWQQIKGREIPLLTEIVKRQNEMLFLEQELEGLPAKIPYDQAHGGRKLEKLNYEKKRFLDCIKLYVYNTRKRMCEILLEHYDREKEILPALSMIIERGGYVKLKDGRLRVQLRRFKNLEIDYAARGLCEDLNAMNPMTLDKYRLPIWFDVS